MKKLAIVWTVMLALGLVMGCEWESLTDDIAGSGGSGSSNTNSTGGGGSNTNGTDGGDGDGDGEATGIGSNLVSITGEALSVGGAVVAGDTFFSSEDAGFSAIANKPIEPGTVVISVGNYAFSDEGGDGTLTPPAGLSEGDGFVAYGSGAWWIDLGGADVDNGSAVVASYVYRTL